MTVQLQTVMASIINLLSIIGISDSLTIHADTILVEAPEVWGVLHAMETLYQLLFPVLTDSSVVILAIQEQTIHDAPAYRYYLFFFAYGMIL